MQINWKSALEKNPVFWAQVACAVVMPLDRRHGRGVVRHDHVGRPRPPPSPPHLATPSWSSTLMLRLGLASPTRLPAASPTASPPLSAPSQGQLQEGGLTMAKAFVIAGHGAGDPRAPTASRRPSGPQARGRMQALGGSEVIVGDMNRNWYKDNGIGVRPLPQGVPVIELHMDSAGAGAKGGHVIIKEAFSPDAIERLAAFIGASSLLLQDHRRSRQPCKPEPSRRQGHELPPRRVRLHLHAVMPPSSIPRLTSLPGASFAGLRHRCSDRHPAPAPQPAPQPQGVGGLTDDLARRVIAGEFGTGDARKARPLVPLRRGAGPREPASRRWRLRPQAPGHGHRPAGARRDRREVRQRARPASARWAAITRRSRPA